MCPNGTKWERTTAFMSAGLVSQCAFRFTKHMYLLTTFYHALCASKNHNEIESS